MFFFKQKTAYEMRISDWSSDVCSSDLLDFGSSVDVAHWGNGGKSLWGGTWTADDFTGAAGGFGIALRMEVEGRETGRVEEIRFRVHWEVVDQEAVLGEIAVEDRKSTRLNSSH